MATADYVLDARSAMVLLSDTGPAAARLRALTHERVIMDWVSFAEVLAAFERDGGPGQAAEAEARLRARLSLIAEIDPSLGELAGHVRARYDVGIANAFAIATAILYDAALVTANADLMHDEREWRVDDLRPHLLAQVDAEVRLATVPMSPAELVDPRLRGRLRNRPVAQRAREFYGT